MIRFVKEYERKKLKQHPVGMTGYTQSDNKAMIDSPADWISLGGTGRTNEDGPYKNDPPVADGKKVSLLDTDHIYGVGGGRDWAWKSFLRGHNVLWMDPYDKSSIWEHVPGNADEVRRNLGEIRRFAEKMNLAAMAPANDVSSSRYCLANPGSEYLTYLPQGGAVTVDLSKIEGSVAVEWNNPSTGKASKAPSVAGGMRRDFKAPFEGDAVLYLVRVHH
jgi:hypothetical protein